MKTIASSLFLVIVLLSACSSSTPIRYPGGANLGTFSIPSGWTREEIGNGGRTSNLLIPKTLHLAIAENETRPAISCDLIEPPDGRFTRPRDNDQLLGRHLDELESRYPGFTRKRLDPVLNNQIGPIPVTQIDYSFEHRLASVVSDTNGWYLIELTVDEEDDLEAYTDDFRALLRSIRLEQFAEQGSSGQPATRSESDSEGGDKPQPEAEGRSR